MSATNVYGNTSAILALLRESDPRLKHEGLKALRANIDYLWHEISNNLGDIEILYEDTKFPHRQLVAHIASKVYYHLEDYDESLNYALNSGDFFDINLRDQYTKTLLHRCIDKYAAYRQAKYDSPQPGKDDDLTQEAFIHKLEPIVAKLVEKSLAEGEHKYALGIAIETRNLLKVTEILSFAGQNKKDLLHYLYQLSNKTVTSKKVRFELLKIVVDGLTSLQSKTNADYILLGECYVLLNNAEMLGKLLVQLASSSEEKDLLLSYQMAFDLAANDNERFSNAVIERIPAAEGDEKLKERFGKLKKIVSGEVASEINHAFLKIHNKGDPQLIKDLKTTIDSKNSITHGAVIIANAFMQAGTQNDAFITENTEWIAKATHWSRFSATASLGVIYKGNVTEGRDKLKPYFFGGSANPNFPTHGGALYGLGLIFACTKNEEVIEYLKLAIKDPSHNTNESIIHGACLGLGLVGLGSADMGLYEELKNILFSDNAVIGDAAAVAIGLVMVGTGDEEIVKELIQYAHDTHHEKIIRSIALALAMMSFGREQQADVLIEQLTAEKDQLLRYGAMLALGTAYVGTANQYALKTLLHHAVSDVSDDVRKAAVISLGFLLCNHYEQIPKVLSLLAVSFNPHVRYGAAIAIGIACASTVYSGALDILEPLMNDSVDFVRQAAYLGTSMILQQASEQLDPRVTKIRAQIKEIAGKKHEDNLCRLGAILSAGILDAGGRNSVISMTSPSGNVKMTGCVGLLMFTHFWYWFPFVHFLSLSLTPSALIGVNKDVKVPAGFQFKSNAKPSLFDYPPMIKVATEKKEEKAKTAVLSTTNRAKARAAKKEGGGMEIEPGKESPISRNVSTTEPAKPDAPKDGAMEIEKDEKKEEKKEEPAFQILTNPARVLEKQVKHITFLDENRYKPLLHERKKGIVVLNDTTPAESDTYLDLKVGGAPDKDEVAVPEPFTFDEEAHKAAVAKK